MSARVVLVVGTKKGAFLLESDQARDRWTARGPFCDNWPINYATYDPAHGAVVAGGGSAWYGPAVWRSADFGRTWTHSSDGLTFGEGAEGVTKVWSLAAAHGVLYAGVEPAGLFRSDDGGATWSHVRGLRNHPSREAWMPGNAGLILHSIVPHRTDPRQMWVGISVAGTFHTADGGITWEPRNGGVKAPGPVEYPEFGQCVHHVEADAANPDGLFQQNHLGMYASTDAGKTWRDVGSGLPSRFGFAAAVHPHKASTYYLAPLNGDSIGRYMPDGAAAIWRTSDGGSTWEALRNGLPQHGAYFGVFRSALATDSLERAGIYFGTTNGTVYASSDEGDSWREVARNLPTIYSVQAGVI